MTQSGHQIKFLPAYSPSTTQLKNYLINLNITSKNIRARRSFFPVNLACHMVSKNDCHNYYRHILTDLLKCISKLDIENFLFLFLFR